MKALIALAVATGSLSGCYVLTPPSEYPPWTDQQSPSRVSRHNAPPQIVMVVKPETPAPAPVPTKSLFGCSETRAEIAETLAGPLMAALNTPGYGYGPMTANASVLLMRALENQDPAQQKKSQGIQLVHDGVRQLCQARMNGFITNEQYYESSNKLLELAIPLIREELALMRDGKPVSGRPQAPSASERFR
jgi:hypothetical protein